MYLASRLADNLELDDHQKSIVRVCAILHDSGHGPFSHVSEGFMRTHEELATELIRKSQLRDTLSVNFDLKEILETVRGEGSLGQIISGELDVDRMDYLLRDSYYTGVAYGVIDVERLIYNMELGEHLMIKRKGVQAAESMLLARYFMYPSVYQHHTTRIINSMFRRCLKKLFDEGVVNPNRIYHYDDVDVIAAARSQEGYVRDMIRRMDNRDLFKTVYSIEIDEINNPETLFKMTESEIRRIEVEISEDLNVQEDNIILDIPEYPSFDEMSTIVSLNGSQVKLGDTSMLVNALKGARFKHADVCIYLPEEYAEKASKFSFKDYIPI
jgi:HD superfamily phosphohydrolase